MRSNPSHLPSLGLLQQNVEKLRSADNAAKREELRARAAATRATEKAISARQALLNAVAARKYDGAFPAEVVAAIAEKRRKERV